MALDAGQTLGCYSIVAPLGAGGMGEVYLARDTKLDREVAIKVLPADVAENPERLQRFEREAKAVAALNHPNIVTIHAIEQVDELHFIAMEHVEGQSLDRVISSGDITLAKIFDLTIPLADALASAHHKGIVHRDLKPGNVMVTKEGRVKILDFGLAKLTNDDQEGSSPHDITLSAPLTGRGVVIGTVPYMSPEQLQGEPVDHRTDLFALGVMLYELATGQRPFQGKNSATITSSILRDEPSPVQELNTAMPRHLARIVNQCLEKDPEHRYQTAKDVRNALRALRKEIESGSDFNEPVAAASQSAHQITPGSATSMSGSALSAPTRRGEFWGGVCVVLVVLIAGLWFIRNSISTSEPDLLRTQQGLDGVVSEGTPRSETGRIDSLVVLPLENLSRSPDQEYFSDGMTDALISDLGKISSLRVTARTTAMKYKGSDEPISAIADALGVDAVLEGSVLRIGDNVRITAQLIEAANERILWSESYERDLRDIFAMQREVAREVAEQIQIELTPEESSRLTATRLVNPDAYELYLKARSQIFKRTVDDVRSGIALLEQAIEIDPDFALAHAGKADAYLSLVSYDLAPKVIMPKAKSAALRAVELDESSAEAHAVLGSVYLLFDWDWELAKRELDRALELKRSLPQAHLARAKYLVVMGRTEEAMAALEMAYEYDAYSVANSEDFFVVSYMARRFDKTRDYAERALGINPDFWLAHLWLGQALLELGDLDAAIAAAETSAQLVHDSVALANLGYAYARAGLLQRARESIERLEGISKDSFVCSYRTALVHVGLDQVDEAFDFLGQSCEDRSECLPFLNADIRLDPIRGDPRFRELLECVGLEADPDIPWADPESHDQIMLAVLPFKNLGSPEDEYFSDGISDEIRSRLARVSKLDVISRSSAFQYRNSQKTNRQIGDELGVDFVIDGTIRWDKRGGGTDRVRITPELVRISDDVSLWSQPYNRSLEDIFEVQSDIASQVFEQLQVTLLEPEQQAVDKKPTSNTEAYQAYLRGCDYASRPDFSEEHYQVAIQMFELAVSLDPEFALAYAELSKAYAWMVHEGFDTTQTRVNQSRSAAEKALALQPDSAEAQVALAEYHYRCHRNFDRALEALAIAEASLPNDAAVIQLKSFILRRQGKFEQAVDLMRRTFELDPRSQRAATTLAETFLLLNKFEQSLRWSDRSLELNSERVYAFHLKATTYWNWNGDLASSRRILEKMPRRPIPYAVIAWFRQELFEGNYAAALRELNRHSGDVIEMQNWVFAKDQLAALVYRAMGETQKARSADQAALDVLNNLVAKQPDDHRIRSALGIVLAGLGRSDEAIREGKRGIELFPESKDAWVGPHRVRDLAYIYTLLGEHDLAMDRIEYLLSIAWDDLSIPLLRIDPRWNPLRTHPRYRKLMIANGYDLEIPPSPKSFSLPEKTTLAVLPFENINSDPDTDYLSNEIPANLIDAMSALSGLNTISRSGTFRFDSQKEDATRFGEKLGATVVMTGQINARGKNLTIRAELVDVATNKQLWSKRYPRELTDIIEVESDITKSIAEALRIQLTTNEKSKLAKKNSINPDAYRSFLEGRYWWNRRSSQGFDRAIRQYDRAIQIDPNFAKAYAGKAETYAMMAYYTHPPKDVLPLAKSAAHRAIELAPNLAAPHTIMAYIQHVHEHDFDSGEKNFRKAIQLDPSYATAYQWYATLLMTAGRFAEAEDQFKKAQRIDPDSLIIHRDRAKGAINRREFDEAERRLRETLDIDPNYSPALYHLAGVYIAQRRLDEAIGIFRNISQYSGNAAAYEGLLGYALGLAGRTAEANRELERIQRAWSERYIPAFAFALIYAGLGDFDRAFAYFDQAFDDRAGEMVFLKYEPIYDPLRHDARFDRLLDRIGFPGNRPSPIATSWIPKQSKLAIFPFENISPDPDTDYLSNEIPANLIDTMSGLSGLDTISRSGAFRFDPRVEDATEFGRNLGATVVLTGQINARGKDLTIRAELVDVSTNKQLWSKRYPRELTDIIEVESDITKSISEALRIQLTANEETQMARAKTANPDARLAYMQGRYWWNKRSFKGFEKSLEYYERAILLDSSYALAYAGQAATYAMMGAYTHRPKDVVPLAEKAAQRAVELQPDLAEAYTTLGWIQGMYHWKWKEAERTFERALELNPKFGTAHQWYSVLLSVQGRLEESLRRAEMARKLEPNSAIINLDFAWSFAYQGDYEKAKRAFQQILEMEYTFAPARYGLGVSHLISREFDDAIREFRLARSQAPDNTRNLGLLGYALGLAGRRTEALAELKRFEALAKSRYVTNATFGLIYAGLSDFDRAFEYFNKSLDAREVDMAWIAVGPSYHPMRHDSRFDLLIKRLGFSNNRPHHVVEHWLPEPMTLAVLPFDNVSSDPDTDYLSNEIPASIIDTLSPLSGLRVIARSGSFRFDSTKHDPSSFGQSLGASVVLTGQINARGNDLTVRAELVDVQSNVQLWSKRYPRELTDIMEVERDITQNISTALRLHLTSEERTNLTKSAGISADAYKSLLQGRFWHQKFTLAGWKKSLQFFQEAVRIDPKSAIAHAELSKEYSALGIWFGDMPPSDAAPKARRHAETAIALDKNLGDAYVALAFHLLFHGWDWPGAENAFKRAIQLEPESSDAHIRYAIVHRITHRFAQAEALLLKAQELDPTLAMNFADMGATFAAMAQYDKAIDQCRKALILDPQFPPAHVVLGGAYLAKGMYDEAIRELEIYSSLMNRQVDDLGYLGSAYAMAGNRSKAMEILNEMRAKPSFGRGHVAKARVYSGLGDLDSAFDHLETGVAQGDPGLIFINIDYQFEMLRSDPRYPELARRMKFEPNSKSASAVPSQPKKIMLAVLPFNNLSNDPEQEYFSDGMTEELITRLGRLRPGNLGVIARTSAMRYKNTHKSIDQIGHELSVDYVIEGGVRRAGGQVRINAQLIQVSDETQLWGNSYTRSLSDVFAVQTEVAEAVASALAVTIIPDVGDQQHNTPTNNSDAHDAYLLGRHYWAQRSVKSIQTAITHFERAIALDPNYALAYSGLADAWGVLPYYQIGDYAQMWTNSQKYAQKAIELNPSTSESQTSMALVHTLKGKFKESLTYYQRAIELDPNNASAHHWYGLALSLFGKFNEAHSMFRRGIALDPQSVPMRMDYGDCLLMARRTDLAIEQLKTAIDLNPEFYNAHDGLTWAFLVDGQEEEAARSFEQYLRLTGQPQNAINVFKDGVRTGGYCTGALNWLNSPANQTVRGGYSYGDKAAIHAWCGETDSAFGLLEQSLNQWDPEIIYMGMYPSYEKLRSDPRWNVFIQKTGIDLPEAPDTVGTP